VPAFDGLRGLAVLAVVAFHLRPFGDVRTTGAFSGGWLGVDAFFTLSGYLITSLLLAELQTTGTVRLRSFWRRRIRRLQPAALIVIAATVATARWWSPPGTGGSVRSEAFAAMASIANWQALWADRPYAAGASPSAFEHFWSLAIEEQFYVAWPVVLAAIAFLVHRRRGRHAHIRGAVLAVSGVGLAVSWILLARFDFQRAYLGTDARIGSILLGAALAALLPMHRAQLRREHKVAHVMGVVALGVMLLAWFGASWPPRVPLSIVLPLHAVATAGLIAAVVLAPARGVARVLQAGPLAAIGRVSYGIYLWHWPVVVLVTPARLGASELTTNAVRVVLVAALVAVSWYLVEHPIRVGQRLPRTRVALPAGVAFAATAVVAGVAGIGNAPVWAQARGQLVQVAPPARVSPPTTTTTPTSATTAPEMAAPATARLVGAPPLAWPPRVLVVGDSVPTSLLNGYTQGSGPLRGYGRLLEQFAAQGVPAASATITSCPVLEEAIVVFGANRQSCQDIQRRFYPEAMGTFRPTLIVWFALADSLPVADASGAVTDPIDSPQAAAALRQRYAHRLNWFASHGARVIFVLPGPHAAGHDAADARGDTFRSAIFAEQQVRRVAAAHRDVVLGVVAMNDLVCPAWPAERSCADVMPGGGRYRPDDGEHFGPDGAIPAGEWLVQQVVALSTAPPQPLVPARTEQRRQDARVFAVQLR
jgi:peptidoglycan/LPS O-acetylase OafA/YrhL